MKCPLAGATIVLLILGSRVSAQTSPTNRPGRVCAGAYFFEGWTGKTNHVTERLKTEFADREPVWGWNDDSPQVMQRQIDLAADHGLSFFAFDWYWPESREKRTPLNRGLELYLDAPNRDRLQFCLLVANHGGYQIGPADWDGVCDVWLKLFEQPNRLRVAGKPLLIFFSPRDLLDHFAGVIALKAAFNQLQSKARSRGLAGVSIAACCAPGPEHGWIDLADLKAAGFTCLTGYNYHGYPKAEPAEQKFAAMIAGHEDLWNRFAAKGVLPYMPCVTTGWDKRPWEDARKPPQAPYYPDRSPQQVTDFISRAARWMDAHPDKTPAERIVLLYAWNEYGEGGYLAPTKGSGDAYLRAVADGLAAGK